VCVCVCVCVCIVCCVCVCVCACVCWCKFGCVCVCVACVCVCVCVACVCVCVCGVCMLVCLYVQQRTDFSHLHTFARSATPPAIVSSQLHYTTLDMGDEKFNLAEFVVDFDQVRTYACNDVCVRFSLSLSLSLPLCRARVLP